ncbi:hypothetical protein [Streptomyces coelicoflavus]|uniref:hypothetical protein n=1 Tax=Streptomyces coelicoflavus TaxID=285562 RepID=UPI003629C0A0
MQNAVTDRVLDGCDRRHGHAVDARPPREWVRGAAMPVSWRALGLEAMASLLIVSLSRLSSRCFAARCQWPRLHPLNERTLTAVPHHPLIMVESTRQLARALELDQPSAAGTAPLEAVSVSLGLQLRALPVERGSATDVSVRMRVSDLSTQAGHLLAHRVTAEYLHAGQPFGTCTMRLTRSAGTAPPPEEAMRSGLLHPSAAAVGAAAEGDVMLARAPQGRLVIAPRDRRHPEFLAGRPAHLPLAAVLEAGRQAVLLDSGMTAAAVIGLRADVCAPVPSRGAHIETRSDPGGCRYLVTFAGRPCATGAVTLLRP